MSATPSLRGICELVLEAHDPERVERFYRGLGLSVLARETDRVWLAAGPRSRLGIWSPGTKEHGDRGGRHVHFALAMPRGSLTALAARLRSERIDVEGPVEQPGGDRSIYLTDPAGNRVELWDFFCEGEGLERGVEALAKDDV